MDLSMLQTEGSLPNQQSEAQVQKKPATSISKRLEEKGECS